MRFSFVFPDPLLVHFCRCSSSTTVQQHSDEPQPSTATYIPAASSPRDRSGQLVVAECFPPFAFVFWLAIYMYIVNTNDILKLGSNMLWRAR